MNYQHIYHAGNFADVFKHVLLTLLLKSLHAKDTPFRYFETHAGGGRYDLQSAPAQQTGEYRDGIARLWARADAFPELADYLAAVRAANPGGKLRFYPGSPRIARSLLRSQDRMQLFELVPEECERLGREFGRDAQVRLQAQDGYAGLKAMLPPPERRGLVLMDPPYEAPTEFTQVFQALKMAHGRWASGMYALWYPIKERAPVTRLHARLVASGMRKILCAEFLVYPEDTAFRLNGCGMVLVNPPWKLDETLGGLLPRLLAALAVPAHPAPTALERPCSSEPVAGRGRTAVSWLAPE